MNQIKLTVAQAIIRFLSNQYVERDKKEQQFFAGCFGEVPRFNLLADDAQLER